MIAASKNIYENLIQTEITDYLKEAYLDYDALWRLMHFHIGDLSKVSVIKTRNKRKGSLLFLLNITIAVLVWRRVEGILTQEDIEYLCKKYGYTLESFEFSKYENRRKIYRWWRFFLKFNNKNCE